MARLRVVPDQPLERAVPGKVGDRFDPPFVVKPRLSARERARHAQLVRDAAAKRRRAR